MHAIIRGRCVALLLTVAALGAFSPRLHAQAPPPATNRPPQTGATLSTNRPLSTTAGSTNRAVTRFRPITKPAPTVRLTGGSRGTGDQEVRLDVLAPADVGFTTREQPSLFWFQSRPAKARLEFAILRENQPEPVFQKTFDPANQTGLQRIDLKGTDIRLAHGIEYQWIVALVLDPDNRSSDLVASGFIQRTEPTVETRRKIEAADAKSQPNAWAEAGFWYDAVALLSDHMAAEPNHPDWRKARAELLRKAGLEALAEAEPARP